MPQKTKILVVEDEPDFRHIMERLLKKAGYAVVTAANGEDGLRLYVREAPDLVLLDVHLPDMEGPDICRKIRAEGPRPKTPVILCTVRSEVTPVAQGIESGATDYIIKPFEVQDMLDRVAAALVEKK